MLMRALGERIFADNPLFLALSASNSELEHPPVKRARLATLVRKK
jgi:hypothetical protein